MKTPQFLKSLWGKIEEKIKKQGDAKSQPAKDPDVPSTDLPPYRYRAVHHHPNAHEVQHRAAEREYWQDQLRLSKELNVITKTLNTITIAGTILVGLATAVGFGSLILLWCTLVETIENDRVEQRAWVGPKVAEIPPEVKAGISLKFGVEQVNSGKTPAIHVKGITRGRSVFKSETFVPHYQNVSFPLGEGSTGIIQPGTSAHMFTPPITLTPEQANSLQAGETVFYWHGEISYEDIFGGVHCTMYCFFLEPGLKSTSQCLIYNEVKDVKCEHTD